MSEPENRRGDESVIARVGDNAEALIAVTSVNLRVASTDVSHACSELAAKCAGCKGASFSDRGPDLAESDCTV